ncbi:MAG: hypothetical protein Q4E73_06880 [Lachnospiraceae bacterium]|nr:hypothetical protein [Lachnospiraceae bacterium]
MKDEALWLSTLRTKNTVAHAYNKNVAYDIVRQTKEQYYEMFMDLKKEMEENWMLI